MGLSDRIKTSMVEGSWIRRMLEEGTILKRQHGDELEYAGVKQRYATCVVVSDLVFCSGMTGRTPETGDVSSDNVAS